MLRKMVKYHKREKGGRRVDNDLRTMNDGDVIHYTGTVHILSDIQSKPVIPTDANGHSVTNVVSVSLLSPYGLGSCRVNRILWLVKVICATADAS
jgi:hypothetical protein